MKKWIRNLPANINAAILLAFAGAILYSALSVSYAFTQRSTIDEGLYQYIGYLFASGILVIFMPAASHSSFCPTFAATLPNRTASLIGPA